MEKNKLTAEMILNKSFNVDFKGYAACEVDEFLDSVLEDYEVYDNNIKELKEKIDNLEKENARLKAENLELDGKNKVSFNTSNFSSVDLLKRVSRLEQEVFKNK